MVAPRIVLSLAVLCVICPLVYSQSPLPSPAPHQDSTTMTGSWSFWDSDNPSCQDLAPQKLDVTELPSGITVTTPPQYSPKLTLHGTRTASGSIRFTGLGNFVCDGSVEVNMVDLDCGQGGHKLCELRYHCDSGPCLVEDPEHSPAAPVVTQNPSPGTSPVPGASPNANAASSPTQIPTTPPSATATPIDTTSPSPSPTMVFVSDILPSAIPLKGTTVTLRGVGLDQVQKVTVVDASVPFQKGPYEITFDAPPQETTGYKKTILLAEDGFEYSIVLFYTEDCPLDKLYGVLPDCRPCPDGATCPGGYRMVPEPGYHLSPQGVPTPCEAPATERCPGGPGNPCGEAYEGITCQNCADGYSFQNGVCASKHAARKKATVIVIVCVAIGAIAVAAGLIWWRRRPKDQSVDAANRYTVVG